MKTGDGERPVLVTACERPSGFHHQGNPVRSLGSSAHHLAAPESGAQGSPGLLTAGRMQFHVFRAVPGGQECEQGSRWALVTALG